MKLCTIGEASSHAKCCGRSYEARAPGASITWASPSARSSRRLPFWSEALGLEVSHIETVESEGVKVAFLPVGEARIELLEPAGDDSTVARYLDKRGGGIHHLTFAVPDIDAMVERLYSRDVEISAVACGRVPKGHGSPSCTPGRRAAC